MPEPVFNDPHLQDALTGAGSGGAVAVITTWVLNFLSNFAKREDLANLRVECADKFATKVDIEKRFDAVDSKLDKMLDKIDEMRDRQ